MGNATQVGNRGVVIKIAMEIGKCAVGLNIAPAGSWERMAVGRAKFVVKKLALVEVKHVIDYNLFCNHHLKMTSIRIS